MERAPKHSEKKLSVELECRNNSPVSKELAAFRKLGSPATNHQETLAVLRSQTLVNRESSTSLEIFEVPMNQI